MAQYVKGYSNKTQSAASLTSQAREIRIDAFGGNFGSPIFLADTWKVVGILVRGADDYALNSSSS